MQKLDEQYTDVSSVNDLKQYFSRPILIDTINYNSGIRTSLATYELTTSSTKARIRNFDRISGCFGWRATFCFRLQAIATPFQAGRVRMAFQPFRNQTAYDRLSSVTPISQLPGVDLDIAETTSAILKVPFISNKNYFNYQTQADDDLGTVGVFAYTSVALAAGATSPKIAVWHWLEDFEIIAAAPAAIEFSPVPAALVAPPTGVSPFESVQLDTIIEAQAGRYKAASSAESDAIPGNLSNVLSAGSKLALWGMSKIPLISSFAGPTSWMLRETAKIAASYGWSKPLNSTPNSRMIQTVNTYQSNVDGADTTFSLGASVDNAVQPLPGFAGTNVDEMSIDYVKGVYTAISNPSLSAIFPVDTLIYACNITPSAMWFQGGNDNYSSVTLGTQVAFWPSSVMGLSNCFNLWRGGFKFRIKMSKTKFHTGRLLLGFTPVRTSVSAGHFLPTDYNSMDFKSVIWDLREGNVIEFEVPFISEYSWIENEASIGTFHITVVEPLQGPDTVASTVPFIVEVAGAPDLEFAFPNTPEYWPAPTNSVYVAQSGVFEPYATENTTTQAANCIGEKINSVKQLLSKASFIASTFSNLTFYIRSVEPPTWSAGTAGELLGLDPSWRAYFNFFYGMERGGLCYHLTPNGRDALITASIAYFPSIESPISNTTHMESSTAMHVKVPYYSRWSRNITGSFIDVPGTQLIVRSSFGPSTTRLLVQERAADDFQFGYYLGAPPLARGISVFPAPYTTVVNSLSTNRT